MTVSVIVCNVVLTLWFLRVLVAAYVAEKKDSAVVKRMIRLGSRLNLSRRSSGNFEENQTDARRRTFDSAGSTNVGNPLEQHVEMAVMRRPSKLLKKLKRVSQVPDAIARLRTGKRKFTKHTTAEGRDYYVEEDTNESVWELPPDGELV